MSQQYEQQCNAAARAKMGGPIIKNFQDKNLAVLDDWMHQGQPVAVDYPDQTAVILDNLLREQRPITAAQATPA